MSMRSSSSMRIFVHCWSNITLQYCRRGELQCDAFYHNTGAIHFVRLSASRLHHPATYCATWMPASATHISKLHLKLTAVNVIARVMSCIYWAIGYRIIMRKQRSNHTNNCIEIALFCRLLPLLPVLSS